MTIIDIQTLMRDSGVGFGTSGARGLVTQMTDEVCTAYTLAFLHALGVAGHDRRVALGMDLRPSSPAIARACAAGIRQAGCEVDFCGALPTPALALYGMQSGIPAIMVTGSHIPFDRNGIKFYRADGEISKADEAAIAAARVDVKPLTSNDALPVLNPAAIQAYRERYRSLFPANLLTGWRIGVYEHSSVARDILKTLLTDLGAEVIGIGRTDTFVPIDTEAVSEEDRQRGRQWSAEYGLDALISTDGDGDRPLIGDETGDWLRGDIVGLFTAQFLGAETVVAPVSCNTAIERSGLFRRVVRTRIGSPFVIEGMALAEGPVAGFEANGGFLAGNGLSVDGHALAPLPTRDAVLPALIILAMARGTGVTVSALSNALPQRYTASDRIQNFPTDASRALLAQLQSDANACQELWRDRPVRIVDFNTTDGLRMTLDSGDIVHLRPSGNAPELRCYAEADSVERAQDWVDVTLQRLRQRTAC